MFYVNYNEIGLVHFTKDWVKQYISFYKHAT